MKTMDPVLIQEAIGILNSTKSIEYAKVRMNQLIDEANAHLDKHFPPS